VSKEKKGETIKKTNVIRLSTSKLKYLETLKDSVCFGQRLNGFDEKYKLLSDAYLIKSYQFHDIRYSKKMDLPYHSIIILEQIHATQPSSILSY